MEKEFSVFKRYPDIEQAKALCELLEENNIPTILTDNSPLVDVTFANNTLDNEIQVSIPQKDFDKARDLLEKEADIDIEQIDKDYYLFEFTNEELYNILLKPDEWGEFDFVLAQKILKSRGQEINLDLLSSLRHQRIEDLSKPESNQNSLVGLGYLLAFLGGIIGIFIGYSLWNQKKNLPSGEKVYTYKEEDRQHGKNIFFIGIFVLILFLLLQIIYGDYFLYL